MKYRWIRPTLYAASVVSGIFAAIFPVAAFVLVPVATGLAGLAKETPGTVQTVVGPPPAP